MKNFIFPILVVIVAGISVGLSEVSLMTWLGNMPFDVTGNLFWTGVLPAQLIVVGITTLVLMKVYKHKPLIYMPLYAMVFAGLHAYELNSFFNPTADILRYMASIAVACLFWFAILWRFYLRTPT